MVNPLSWDALAAISASVAAIVAAFQLQLSRIDSNKRLAISLLRDFTAILEKLNLYDIKVVAASVTASYEQGVPLTQEGSVYIAIIHSLGAYQESCPLVMLLPAHSNYTRI